MAAPVQIELRPQVVAPQRQVRLGDVAYLRTSDLAAIQRLVNLPLGQAPRPGQQSVLERDVLARWVRSQTGIAADAVIWHGAERSRVTADVQVIPAARIADAARAALAQWLAARTVRFDLEGTGSLQDLSLPAGAVEFSVRALPAGAQPSTRMVMWVDVRVDGHFVRSVPATFLVEAYGEAWVARSSVAPSAVLAPAMLERKTVNIAAQPAALAAGGSADALVSGDVSSRRTIKAGEALTGANVARVAAVSRGEWVTLLLKAGTMRMESRAEALQAGEVGQRVRVRVAGAVSPLDARVTERGRVEATQ
ncbi:MAG TPA: flagellar basal body P-ring formation chaperone FlgA [Ramlibacter sp.]|nr:flagellar basal body P-ring formation chaperone FlgA [Ramlibacter sp.]